MLDRDHALMVDPKVVTGVFYYCPACISRVEGHPRYCPHCGQLLNWRIVREIDKGARRRCPHEDVNHWCGYYRIYCKGSLKCRAAAAIFDDDVLGHVTLVEREADVRAILKSFDWEEQKNNIDYVNSIRRTEVIVEG